MNWKHEGKEKKRYVIIFKCKQYRDNVIDEERRVRNEGNRKKKLGRVKRNRKKAGVNDVNA